MFKDARKNHYCLEFSSRNTTRFDKGMPYQHIEQQRELNELTVRYTRCSRIKL